jgi:hypothetical protein
MMPDTLTAHLIADVWTSLDEAVTNGLAEEAKNGLSRQVLADVVVVSDEKISSVAKWDTCRTEDIGNGTARIRESGQVSDFMYRYPLSYDELHSPVPEKIESWAAAVRRKELTYVLDRYAAAASGNSFTMENLFEIDPGGWGKRRCVVFKSAANPPKTFPDHWPNAELDRTVKVDMIPQQGGIEAVVFRIADGPYVRRPADLSLGWMPAGDYGAELILTERLEFVGMGTAGNIIGVRLAWPATSPSS